jgi:hypothetical protein
MEINQEWFQKGRDLFLKHKTHHYEWKYSFDSYDDYRKFHDKNHGRTRSLEKGYQAARDEFVKPYAKEFFAKLEKFQKENNASICTGCGCCGGGYILTIDGHDYELEGDYNDQNQVC